MEEDPRRNRPPASSWSHRETIPSDTRIGSSLVEPLLEAMLDRGWATEEQFRVRLAYEEAVVNAIVHGNRRSPEKSVQVEMSCADDQIQIHIEDEGAGFEPSEVPDPRQADRLELPGGRGLLMMRETMSEVRYNRRGNGVTLTKRRGAESDADEPSPTAQTHLATGRPLK